MTLVLAGSPERLEPAGWPQIPRFLLDVEHSSRLREVFGRNAALVTDSIRMRSPDQVALLLDRYICAVVLWISQQRPVEPGIR